jgi:hypothetical protein
MRTSVLLMVTAMVYGAYGLGFLFSPGTFIALYGGEIGSIGAFTTQLYAAMLLGVSIMCWQVKDAPRNEAFMAILLGLFVAMTIATIIVGMNQFTSPTARAWAWMPWTIQALLAAGFGYARFGPDPDRPRD